ncbi:MAG TPA: hypothetical protein VJS44_08335 [Pyrinomonadaceae bacterium]|nr:hypothetical protein [Pyrinomonadaceae bacterium]
MFDYVSREKYHAEVAARMRAEAEAANWREQVRQLTEQNKQERERFDAQLKDLLDRGVPPKPYTGPLVTGQGIATQLSSKELEALPAVGRYGMRQRAALVREARAREEREEAEAKVERQKEALAPDEAADLEESLVRAGT